MRNSINELFPQPVTTGDDLDDDGGVDDVDGRVRDHDVMSLDMTAFDPKRNSNHPFNALDFNFIDQNSSKVSTNTIYYISFPPHSFNNNRN
jgi:hypothetical protein